MTEMKELHCGLDGSVIAVCIAWFTLSAKDFWTAELCLSSFKSELMMPRMGALSS